MRSMSSARGCGTRAGWSVRYRCLRSLEGRTSACCGFCGPTNAISWTYAPLLLFLAVAVLLTATVAPGVRTGAGMMTKMITMITRTMACIEESRRRTHRSRSSSSSAPWSFERSTA
eukprot:COSAG01_NODE_119_length_25410_cov_1333.312275_31_plen_116_part_00